MRSYAGCCNKVLRAGESPHDNEKERGCYEKHEEKNCLDIFCSYDDGAVLSGDGFCRGRSGRICAVYVRQLLGADSAGGSDCAGADYEGGIQFSVYRDFDRRSVLFRAFV